MKANSVLPLSPAGHAQAPEKSRFIAKPRAQKKTQILLPRSSGSGPRQCQEAWLSRLEAGEQEEPQRLLWSLQATPGVGRRCQAPAGHCEKLGGLRQSGTQPWKLRPEDGGFRFKTTWYP